MARRPGHRSGRRRWGALAVVGAAVGAWLLWRRTGTGDDSGGGGGASDVAELLALADAGRYDRVRMTDGRDADIADTVLRGQLAALLDEMAETGTPIDQPSGPGGYTTYNGPLAIHRMADGTLRAESLL